jgi:hypothetical protein
MSNMTTTEKRKAKDAVNGFLFDLGKTYQDGLPIGAIIEKLNSVGFTETEDLEGVYCGREGRVNATVGNGVYLTLSWYKMPSGRYEVTSYVS